LRSFLSCCGLWPVGEDFDGPTSFEVASDGLAEAGSEGRNVQEIDITFYRSGPARPRCETRHQGLVSRRLAPMEHRPMDATLHTIIAAHHIQDRMAEATAARAARDVRRRRFWTRKSRHEVADRDRQVTAPRVTATSS
jgi:hypothetical protein